MTAQESRPAPAPRVTPAEGAPAAVPTTSARRDRLEAIRDDALDLAERLGRDMRAVSEARESSNVDDEHDPEGATIAYERSQLDAIRRSALVRAADAEAALARLGDGDGDGVVHCERCGDPIPAARLEARPTARTCVPCAS